MTDSESSSEERRRALHAIYWLVDDAKTVLEAGDTAEVRRTLDVIRDAVLRGLGDEKP